MTYIIIAIVIVLIVVVIRGMMTLHSHVDKTTKELMVRFSMVGYGKTGEKANNALEEIVKRHE